MACMARSERSDPGGGDARPEVTIIVTTMNEEDTIERCLRRIVAVFPTRAEILVVDGGTDRTGRIVQEVAAEFSSIVYVANPDDRGKGHAMHVGLAAAAGDYIAQIDADLQFLPEELPLILEPLERDRADLVLGSRFTPGAKRLPGSTPAVRTFGNWVVSRYSSLLFGGRMTDVLAGMKAWKRTVTDRIRLVAENCSYDAELPVKALRAGFRVMDVPITTDARQGGVSAIHVVRDGGRILRDVTRFRFSR
jgi:glycosyltransferase involved in cell wall biosynthesis